MVYEADQWAEIQPELNALVGKRIYPGALPTSPVMPSITYTLVSSPRNMVQTGPSMTRRRYQWDCWAKTYDESVTVANALMTALNGEGRWIDVETDAREPLTGLFRRRIESLKWIEPPEA